MARTKGMLNLSGNLEVNAGAPLDARTVVPTVADLTNASNFQYKYVGMSVVVQATGDMYILTANDVTVAANWKQVGSGGGGSSYTAGDGIDITNDEISVKAGSNLSFDSSGNLNATDTTYTAGTGIDITNNVISATGGGGTSYTAGDGIVIEDDEISTDNMPAADMSEIVTPLPSVMSRLHTYSEDEKIVAYWEEIVDGVKVRKPVYEKTLYNLSFPQGDTSISVSALNIDRLISCEGNYSKYGNTYRLGTMGTGFSFYMLNQNTLTVEANAGASAHSEACLTLQYTKTTDTPV